MDLNTVLGWWAGTQPVLWIRGPGGTGKTALVQRFLDVLGQGVVSSAATLSVGTIDGSLRSLVGEGAVTTAGLLAGVRGVRLVVLDALECTQSAASEDFASVTDLRLHRLLSEVAYARAGALRLIVTSKLPPPADLPADAIAHFTVPLAVRVTPRREVLREEGASYATPLDAMELAMDRRLGAGDAERAFDLYWNEIGNFSSLMRQRELHRGLRICRKLNGDAPPHRVNSALAKSEGAQAVLNDWGQFAVCAGDANTAVAAGLAAWQAEAHDDQPWTMALLARHVSDAYRLAGRLPSAAEWARRVETEAVRGARSAEGMATREVMKAFDDAAEATMHVMALTDGPEAVAQEFAHLVAVHERQRDVLQELRLLPVIWFPIPTGTLNPERLLGGRGAAMVALLEGRPEEADRILTAATAAWDDQALASPFSLGSRTLLLRARLAAGADDSALELLDELRELADHYDFASARCELVAIAAQVQLEQGRADAALESVDALLPLATELRLAIREIDLLNVRAQALLGLGRERDAQETARAALQAATDPGCGYRVGALAANLTLQKAGVGVDAGMNVPNRSSFRRSGTPTRPRRRSPAGDAGDPVRARAALHETALEVLDAYETNGRPFALYLRSYGHGPILHGPLEYGARLLENTLHDALPPDANLLTIQDHDSLLGYTGSGSRSFERSAPALLVADENWREVVENVMPFADLIVAECYGLSEGIRFELELAASLRRWDRTVLVLPPLHSPYATIDNDPLVQQFPRCVWADAFHTQPLAELESVSDLVERIGVLAGLPVDERLALRDPDVRLAAHPIDLLPAAIAAEQEVMLSSAFASEDDERTRYYGFWKLFRAASSRLLASDARPEDYSGRLRLAEDYLQMSILMLDCHKEDEQIVLVGDLVFAEQCAQSAYHLAAGVHDADIGPGLALHKQSIRDGSLRQLYAVGRMRAAVEAYPERFLLRPRFGPFTVRAGPA